MTTTRRLLLPLPALLLTRCAGSAEPARQVGAAGPPPLRMNEANLAQGALVTAHTAPGTAVTLDGRAVPVSVEGVFALGFARDAAPVSTLVMTPRDGVPDTRRLVIRKREWDIQRINGLPERQVTPNATDLARIRAEQVRLNAARAVSTSVPHYATGFSWPVRGRISGVYGSQRILNGQERAPHLGLDIAGPAGTPVGPAAAGRVTLAENLYFTGNTVLVEHGQGVTTLYAHLSRIDVQRGQELAQNEVLGLRGMTGRATGPHLHLGLFWHATSLDPATVLEG
ncbi:M23 family metallopeptidase [Roseomonas elaeocarpi]|uniref:M23 family metallopeptidase n=1 Tax=Roseomonas elaeocarpi TaxID=907779 RepID=A0ABV6JMK5_9PROT